MHADKRFIASMFEAGAKAYLLKDSAFSQLAEAIRNVHSGRTYLGDHISDVVVREYVNFLNRREPEMLTSREKRAPAAAGRREYDKGSGRAAPDQRQDGGNPSTAYHGQIEYLQHRRPDEVCHPRRDHLAGGGFLMKIAFVAPVLSTKKSGFLKPRFRIHPIALNRVRESNVTNFLPKGHKLRGERGIYV